MLHFKEALDRTLDVLQTKLLAASDPTEVAIYEAAVVAVERTRWRAEVLGEVGTEALRGILSGWSSDMPVVGRLAIIESSTSLADLAADALADAEALDLDTEARRKHKAEILAWLLELGQAGARILLKLVFA